MNWYLKVFKNYAGFEGRARRKEYWTFILLNIPISMILAFIERIFGIAPDSGIGILVGLYQIAIMLPSTAVAIRRMHDTGRSGWWILAPIANFIFLVSDGTKGDNQYGPDPKIDGLNMSNSF